MYVKRNLERKIEKYVNSPEIIAIVGARQSGKTTLLRKIYSRYKKNYTELGKRTLRGVTQWNTSFIQRI